MVAPPRIVGFRVSSGPSLGADNRQCPIDLVDKIPLPTLGLHLRRQQAGTPLAGEETEQSFGVSLALRR